MSNLRVNTLESLETGNVIELDKLGYTFDYAAGVTVSSNSQIIKDGGLLYRASGSTPLPYTTTGAGMPEDGAFVVVGDEVLRQDLANPDKGAAIVARGVMAVDSIADLLALPEEQRKEGLRYLVKGYHAGSDVGGGEFYWDLLRSQAQHDGGLVISSSSTWDGSFSQLPTFLADAGTGQGCWVRYVENSVSASCFGAVMDTEEDLRPILQHAIDITAARYLTLYLEKGVALLSGELILPSNAHLRGTGMDSTELKLKDDVRVGCVITTMDTEIRVFDPEVSYEQSYNITIEGFTANANAKVRDAIETVPWYASHSGSAVCIRYTRDFTARDIHGTNTTLHGFDVTAAFYYDGYPEGNIEAFLGLRSHSVTIEDCKASHFFDDGFTTHHSDIIRITRCFATDCWGLFRLAFDNSNGFEIDEGSADVVVRDSTATKSCVGFQLKGHGDTASANRGLFENCVAYENLVNFEVRKGGGPLTDNTISDLKGPEVTPFGCKIHRCTSINPIGAGYGFSEGSTMYPEPLNGLGHHLLIREFNSVLVEDFTCLGKDALVNIEHKMDSGPTRPSPIRIMRAHNISLKNIHLDSVYASYAVIDLASEFNSFVTIDHVLANRCIGNIIRFSSLAKNATFKNVVAYASDNSSIDGGCYPVVTSTNENALALNSVTIQNIKGWGDYLGNIGAVGVILEDLPDSEADLFKRPSLSHIHNIDAIQIRDYLSFNAIPADKVELGFTSSHEFTTGISARASGVYLYGKDSSTPPSLAVYDGTVPFKGGVATSVLIFDGTSFAGRFTDDNTASLGAADRRWSDVYAVNTTINTSDRNEKQQIETVSDPEQAVARRIKKLFVKYKWNDAVQEKGEDARIHFGAIAQDVRDSFIEEGMDPERYALFTRDTWYEVDGHAVEVNEDGFHAQETLEADGETCARKINKEWVWEKSPHGEEPDKYTESVVMVQPIERTRLGLRYTELLCFVLAAM